MKHPKRIMFTGPSGVGKTTLAKFISNISSGEDFKWPFISGSISDLLPETRDISHSDMLKSDKEELYTQDFQILNLRKKLFSSEEIYVSDRSFLDSAAYFVYKQSEVIPQCEMENFLELCKMCLCQYCDQLIVLNFTPYLVKNWVMEDNNKRIMNKYFQAHISAIILMVLKNWGVNFSGSIYNLSNGIFKPQTSLRHGGYEWGILESIYGKVDILLINEPELSIRQQIITNELGVNMVWPKK